MSKVKVVKILKVYLDEESFNILSDYASEKKWSLSQALREIIIEWNETKGRKYGKENRPSEDSGVDNKQGGDGIRASTQRVR